ncbi:lachesin-like [Diprion similis]|uniref:lachesin-like n=1 Tax=Diprion similis TaxID=362088 RepID=UPI001EF93ED8|nr:lachesin-like [Diprion similis]
MNSKLRMFLVLCVVTTVTAVGYKVTLPPSNVGPMFVAPVGNQTAATGREAIFTCSIRNIDKYKVGWLRTSDRTILSVHTRTVTHNARISVSYESGSGNSGTTNFVTNQSLEDTNIGTWRLHIRHLKESDRDCYMCQINTSPMISEEGCLDILVPPDIVYGGETSADLAVSEGDNATLTCRATGRPTPRVSWRREDGEPVLTRSSSSTSSGVANLIRHDTFNGSVLQLHRVERKQMGAYLCIASNDVPPAVSKRVTLAVNFAPAVKVPNQLLGAPLGTDVQLECYVEAFPNTINYWLKHRGEMLLDGPKYNIREDRSGYRVLMWLLIRGFTQEDVGTYNCVSTNSLGKAEGTLRLYEIKIFVDIGRRGNDEIAIYGGSAEAARGSGALQSGLCLSTDFSRRLSFVLWFMLQMFRRY